MRERGHVCMEESHSHFFPGTTVPSYPSERENLPKTEHNRLSKSQWSLVKMFETQITMKIQSVRSLWSNINHGNWLKVYQSISDIIFNVIDTAHQTCQWFTNKCKFASLLWTFNEVTAYYCHK